MAASDKSSPPSLAAHRPGRQIKSKRNRRILACSFCREKKLRCDRVQPTCGRCQHGRLPCHYISTPFRDEILANQLFGISFPLGFESVFPKIDSPYDFGSHAAESSIVSPNEASTISSNHHAGFDNPGAYGESRLSSSKQFELFPSLNSRISHLEPPPLFATAGHKQSEAVLHRSLAPKIQFRGSSAAISVLYTTPMILKEVRRICSIS